MNESKKMEDPEHMVDIQLISTWEAPDYMDTDKFIYTIRTDDFYKDIRNDLDAKCDTSDHSDKKN